MVQGLQDFITSNVASGLIGFFIGVVLEAPVKRIGERIRKAWRNLSRAGVVRSEPIQFLFGSTPVPIVVVDVDTSSSYSPSTVITHSSNNMVELPEDLQTLKDKIVEIEEDKKKSGKPYMWNGMIYSLDRYNLGRTPDREDLELGLWFSLSDWFTFQATNMALGGGDKVIDSYASSYNWRNVPLPPMKHFSNTFGVIVSAVSADGYLALEKRSTVIGARSGGYNIPINGNLSPTFDIVGPGNTPDLYHCVVREAREENGLVVDQSEIELFALVVDIEHSMWGIIGSVKSKFTRDEIVVARRNHAKDKNEGEEIFMVPFEPDRVIDFVYQHQPWSPGALTCIYYTLVREFGQRRVDDSIAMWESKYGKDTIKFRAN